MKLIIQIPCFNEEKTLPETIHALPKQISGIDKIEYLVIDDGSTDKTIEVAKKLGVHHILSIESNQGLGKSFISGIRYALTLAADIIVNTDGDNQYCANDIAKIIQPILTKKADMVIGCRPISKNKEFSFLKKLLQILGSWMVKRLSSIQVRDAASGFRAYSRETCLKINLYSTFSHCTESLIQAAYLGLRVTSVDIKLNPKTRESRLFKSIPQYIYQQTKTMIFMFILYYPGKFFLWLGSLFVFLSLLLGVRFLICIYFLHDFSAHRTHLPSLILLSICILVGIIFWILAIIGELIKFHRKTSEEMLYLMRKNIYVN